jgi:acetyl-CoA acyltransferase
LAAETADPDRVNPLGGAIAWSPAGASGGPDDRMAHHMRDNGIRYGLQTMCEGAAAGATLVELVS